MYLVWYEHDVMYGLCVYLCVCIYCVPGVLWMWCVVCMYAVYLWVVCTWLVCVWCVICRYTMYLCVVCAWCGMCLACDADSLPHTLRLKAHPWLAHSVHGHTSREAEVCASLVPQLPVCFRKGAPSSGWPAHGLFPSSPSLP